MNKTFSTCLFLFLLVSLLDLGITLGTNIFAFNYLSAPLNAIEGNLVFRWAMNQGLFFALAFYCFFLIISILLILRIQKRFGTGTDLVLVGLIGHVWGLSTWLAGFYSLIPQSAADILGLWFVLAMGCAVGRLFDKMHDLMQEHKQLAPLPFLKKSIELLVWGGYNEI